MSDPADAGCQFPGSYDVLYENWLKVGLASRILADVLKMFFERHGRFFYATLMEDWKRLPVARGDKEWTDNDLWALRANIDGSHAGTQYRHEHASQQRRDFAEVINQHHVNSLDNVKDTDVQPHDASTSRTLSYLACDASLWGDPDAWLEPLKAYTTSNFGTHAECIRLTSTFQLDLGVIREMLTFCDAFSHCVNQRTIALPVGHPYKVHGTPQDPGGLLQVVCGVRNMNWAHAQSKLLETNDAKAIVSLMHTCLRDPTGGQNSLKEDSTAIEMGKQIRMIQESFSNPDILDSASLRVIEEVRIWQEHAQIMEHLQRNVTSIMRGPQQMQLRGNKHDLASQQQLGLTGGTCHTPAVTTQYFLVPSSVDLEKMKWDGYITEENARLLLKEGSPAWKRFQACAERLEVKSVRLDWIFTGSTLEACPQYQSLVLMPVCSMADFANDVGMKHTQHLSEMVRGKGGRRSCCGWQGGLIEPTQEPALKRMRVAQDPAGPVQFFVAPVCAEARWDGMITLEMVFAGLLAEGSPAHARFEVLSAQFPNGVPLHQLFRGARLKCASHDHPVVMFPGCDLASFAHDVGFPHPTALRDAFHVFTS